MWIIIIIKLLYIDNILYTLNKDSKLNKFHFILGHNSHKQRKLRGVMITLLQTEDLSGLVVQWVSVVLPPPVVLWTRKHFLSDTKFRQQYNSEGRATTGSLIHWVLTDVIVFPEVAQGDVTSNEHGNSTNTTFLHIDVFVVISLIS